MRGAVRVHSLALLLLLIAGLSAADDGLTPDGVHVARQRVARTDSPVADGRGDPTPAEGEPALGGSSPVSTVRRAFARGDHRGVGPPQPAFSFVGLRMWEAGLWSPVPDQLPTGVTVEFAVEVRNVGSAAGTAVLTATAEVEPISEGPLVHVMSGAATVVIAPGVAYFLQLGPAWLPLSAGWYLIHGTVEESGVEIGSFSEDLEVVANVDPCPIPGVDLP
jgi:hypothetical protein